MSLSTCSFLYVFVNCVKTLYYEDKTTRVFTSDRCTFGRDLKPFQSSWDNIEHPKSTRAEPFLVQIHLNKSATGKPSGFCSGRQLDDVTCRVVLLVTAHFVVYIEIGVSSRVRGG